MFLFLHIWKIRMNRTRAGYFRMRAPFGFFLQFFNFLRVGSWFPLKFKIRCYVYNFEGSRSDSGLVRKFENFRNFFVQCSSEIAEFCWRGAENYSPLLKCFALDEFSFESSELSPQFTVYVTNFLYGAEVELKNIVSILCLHRTHRFLTVLINEPTLIFSKPAKAESNACGILSMGDGSAFSTSQCRKKMYSLAVW